MIAKKAAHGLTVMAQGDRLKATCLCGRWLRTTKNDKGAQDRLSGWYVQHVTGANKL